MSKYAETCGYIIHSRNFKDTSLIIDFFSQDFGLIHLIAKGIKKNKKLKSQLQYFSYIQVQYFGKSSLKTISAINIVQEIQFPNLLDKTAGLYLNELLHYGLVENEQAHALFKRYQYTLSEIGKKRLTPLLRDFERDFLAFNGFEISVDSSLDQLAWLTMKENQGLIVTSRESEKICQVRDLDMFINRLRLSSCSQKRINVLMVIMIDMALSNRKIHSRELIKSLTLPVK